MWTSEELHCTKVLGTDAVFLSMDVVSSNSLHSNLLNLEVKLSQTFLSTVVSCCVWCSVCAAPGEGSVNSRHMSSLSLGLFSLPVCFLTVFKTQKQMGFMISPVLLSRFLKVSPQASPFLCTDSVESQG